MVNAIHNNRHTKPLGKFFLIVALIQNIGLLAYFKYANFFLSNVNLILARARHGEIDWIAVVLPIGISFIVFHKISYIIDIYRQAKDPTSMSTYILYILLFPMSIAGPIIKFQNISEQLKKRYLRFDDIVYGLYRFSIGLFKKVWIADMVASIANSTFGLPADQLSFGYAWLGIISYAFQIYFDFSGYADMAIGLSRMMGFKILENFDKPYISQNITEFWRRWHISLSTWMRDYLYIPLGGNRRSKLRNHLNLWIVFLVSGLWHGANWTFVIWGALHGAYLVADKIFWLEQSKKLPKSINTVITFIMVLIAWVFFRSDTIAEAANYLGVMFDFREMLRIIPLQTLYFSNSLIAVFLLAGIITFIPAASIYDRVTLRYRPMLASESFRIIATLTLLSLAVVRCVISTYTPFIYFRF